jgi:hypothetical protein
VPLLLLLLLCRVLMLLCTVTAVALAHCCVILTIYRTVPSDIFQAFAASSLMFEDFGATQVGVVYEANTYGYGLVDNLAPNDGEICNQDTTVLNPPIPLQQTMIAVVHSGCKWQLQVPVHLLGACLVSTNQ